MLKLLSHNVTSVWWQKITKRNLKCLGVSIIEHIGRTSQRDIILSHPPCSSQSTVSVPSWPCTLRHTSMIERLRSNGTISCQPRASHIGDVAVTAWTREHVVMPAACRTWLGKRHHLTPSIHGWFVRLVFFYVAMWLPHESMPISLRLLPQKHWNLFFVGMQDSVSSTRHFFFLFGLLWSAWAELYSTKI